MSIGAEARGNHALCTIGPAGFRWNLDVWTSAFRSPVARGYYGVVLVCGQSRSTSQVLAPQPGKMWRTAWIFRLRQHWYRRSLNKTPFPCTPSQPRKIIRPIFHPFGYKTLQNNRDPWSHYSISPRTLRRTSKAFAGSSQPTEAIATALPE